MKVLIIYLSIHHQNTKKIAEIMAKKLKAKLVKVDEAQKENLSKYDLVGFGSGIYMWKHHKKLLDFVDSLKLKDVGLVGSTINLTQDARAEVKTNFCSVSELVPRHNSGLRTTTYTHKNCLSPRADQVNPRESLICKQAFIFSTRGASILGNYHAALKNKLLAKGFKIVGEFSCLGWDSFGLLKLIGGINKNRPNKKDFVKARQFAKGLKIR